MRWRAWRKQRYPGARFPALICDVSPGAGPPSWRALHPGLRLPAHWSDDAVAVWLVPYPGHAGGFWCNGHVQPNSAQYAQDLSEVVGLFDGPDIAAFETLAVPHVKARLYAVRFDDLQGCVLIQRMPGDAAEYLDVETDEDFD